MNFTIAEENFGMLRHFQKQNIFLMFLSAII